MAQSPSPVISRNVPAYASSNSADARRANDSDWSTEWRSSGQPAWIAYDLSSVPAAQRQQVIVAFHNNSGGYFDLSVIAAPSYNIPGPYVIEGNTAPGGTGSAPASGWVTLVTSPDPQVYRNQQHLITGFNPLNWIRFRTTAGNPNNASGNQDLGINLDIHDVHVSPPDSWMFYGDSITANAWAPGSFTSLISSAVSGFYPAASNGGVPFVKASDVITLFQRWLALFPGTYVGISYGTNDAGTSPTTYYNSMKALVDQVLARGKVPVIPTIPWASASQRNDADIRALNAQIVRLKSDYAGRILDGPDLYALFQNRPDLLGDGLHPNDTGNALFRQAWASKAASTIYRSTTSPPALPGAPTNLRIFR